MPTKMSVLGLGFATVLLAACGNSAPPPNAAPAAPPVAKMETKPEVAPANDTVANPPQQAPYEGYVGVAPPGKVAFGPAPPTQDAAFQAERQRMMEADSAPKKPPPKSRAVQNASQH